MMRPRRFRMILLFLVVLLAGSGPAAVAAPAAAVVVTWVGNLTPNGLVVQTVTLPNTLYVTVEVYAPGITQNPGQGPGIQCWVHFGQVASFGGPWVNIGDIPMAFAGDAGFNDRYGAFVGPLAAGNYEYTAWCSGDGGITPVWADNAATGGNGKLTVLAALTPTPTATPTRTPTPGPTTTLTPLPPGTCQELIRNGGFEQDTDWIFGQTARPPAYVGAPNPIRSGLRSVRMGIVAPTPDTATFSSIQQTVMIPGGAQTASITFSYYPLSQAAAGGLDRQELVLLEPSTGATLAVLWRVTENDQKWKTVQLDLTPFRGRPVTVYFNAQNDGDGKLTAMFLDDVQVLACGTHGPGPQPPMWPTAGPPMWPTAGPPVWPTAGPPMWPTAGPPMFPTLLPVFPTFQPVVPLLPTFPAILATPVAGAGAAAVVVVPVISPGPPTVVTVQGAGVVQVVPVTVTPVPVMPVPTPGPGRAGSPFGEILGNIGPWAVLCLLGVIVIVSLALLAQWWASRRKGS